ncbi:unnamed protein product [Staurois parvus]|uniref:Uncharacterized protein n=1 Tax=Staurois parvus TaxID=386267 RepID=A0ABN9AMD3_9NEOB|nr:unnamed protein product [Staurois parvus]
MPVSASSSVQSVSAAYHCPLLQPISASQCCLSVPIGDVCQCLSVQSISTHHCHLSVLHISAHQ